jgi:hypothetical protein
MSRMRSRKRQLGMWLTLTGSLDTLDVGDTLELAAVLGTSSAGAASTSCKDA